jgi:very-long-chain enoyl-CoA reductase
VHKFSRATMPLANLFRNSTYYWGFAAAVGYPLVSPYYTAPGKEQVAVCLALWVAAQLTNYLVHAQLAGMRGTEGDKTRQPPKGFLFSLVSCPNYTAEVIGWVAWTGLTQIGMAGLFTLFGFYQMRQWAISKHVDYCDEFPEIKKRKAIVPFLI